MAGFEHRNVALDPSRSSIPYRSNTRTSVIVTASYRANRKTGLPEPFSENEVTGTPAPRSGL
jgi:hypothetical protein